MAASIAQSTATSFQWDARAVLHAFDVGIVEVIRIHNRAFASSMHNGTALVGPTFDAAEAKYVPEFNVRAAYARAMDTTIAILNGIETSIAPDTMPPTAAESAFIDALVG